MKLLRKNLLLTVVFGGYFFFSMPSTTQGFIVMAGIYNILVKKVHASAIISYSVAPVPSSPRKRS